MTSPIPGIAVAQRLSLTDIARSLSDGIAARATRTETERNVPVETIDELIESGLTRSLQSANFGGLEANPAEFFHSVIEIASACPSTAWVLAVLSVHPFDFAHWSLAAQGELYRDDPKTLVSSSYSPQGVATTVPGGYRLHGRWRSSSGVDHCRWVVVGARVDDPNSPHVRHVLVPLSDVEIVDDWFVLGLAGTGSKSVVMDNVFVPEHRTMDQDAIVAGGGPGLAVNTNPIFTLPRWLVYLGPGAAPAIGAAKGAYAEYKRQVRSYVSKRSNSNKVDDPYVHLRLAEAYTTIARTERQLLASYEQMTETVRNGNPIDPLAARQYASVISESAHECVTAVRGLFETLGASAVYSSNPIQRFYRDLLTMRQHGTQDRNQTFARLGRDELAGIN